MTVALALVARTFHLALVDNMYRTVLHTVDRNWDRLLVDSRVDTVLNSTYLGDVDCMGRSNYLADMLDNAFGAWVADTDRVLVVDNGMFVDEVFLLKIFIQISVYILPPNVE